MRPRILLCPGDPGWSYDFTARALVEHLSSRFDFDFDVAYTPADVHTRAPQADLIVDFWWRGALEQHYGKRVLKQVSSHRWARHKFGSMLPTTLAAKYLAPSCGVVVPSERLLSIVSNGLAAIGSSVPVTLAPKGFAPELFRWSERTGNLRVGWAGTGRQSDKRLGIIRDACPDLVEVGPYTNGVELPYEQMPGFYQSIDVITCASDAEGDPRPLIEAMACGCFPVTVDVGIVPELVIAGDRGDTIAGGVTLYPRGIVVDRTVDAFRSAFDWCAANAWEIRERGRVNAERMLAERQWSRCAQAWGDAFARALDTRAAA